MRASFFGSKEPPGYRVLHRKIAVQQKDASTAPLKDRFDCNTRATGVE
jgi:hypothetical protein